MERECSSRESRQRPRLAMKASADAAIVATVRSDEFNICRINSAKWIVANVARKIDLLSRKKPPEETFCR